MHRHGPTTFIIGRTGLDLDPCALLGQDQRGLHGELVQPRTTETRACRHGEFHVAGPGEHHGVQQHVVGDPRLRVRVQAPGEHHAVIRRRLEHRAEHRVPGGAQAESVRVACRSGPHPQPVALERVRRQIDSPPGGHDRRPVHRAPPHEDTRERGEQRGHLWSSGTQGRQQGRVRQDLLSQRGQHASRAELQERLDSLVAQPCDGVREQHRRADVPYPVFGREPLDRHAGDVADDRDSRWMVGQVFRRRAEILEHAVHVRGVERVAYPKAFGVRPSRGDSANRVLVTRQHRRGWPIHGRDRDTVR
jgi:hypothetical protein